MGASQADIKRALRSAKAGLRARLTYEWVESHQDRYKLWYQLTLPQQLNCLCDGLAKSAVHLSMSPSSPRNDNLRLRGGGAAVYVRGVKQTSDVA